MSGVKKYVALWISLTEKKNINMQALKKRTFTALNVYALMLSVTEV